MRRKFHIAILLFLVSFATRAQVATSATDSILRYWLKPQTVDNNFPVTNTFYVWMSSLQIDSCLQQNQLLRTTPDQWSYGFAYYDNLYYESTRRNSAMVNHLMGAERQRMLDAWPCYWQDMGYIGNDTARTQLVQVVLMDSALIVAFYPDEKRSDMWKVFDLKGNQFTVEQALLRKRHIAAVYMCSEYRTVFFLNRTRRTIPGHYRGFVLCNENMIKSWHHAVPGLQAKMQQDFDYLMLLNAWFEKPENCAMPDKKGKVYYAAWNLSAAKESVSQLFFATDTYAGQYNAPAAQSTTTPIIEELRKRFRNQKNPCERFPGKNPVYRPK